MEGCASDCPLEANQADKRSVGVVEDDELICRAAYDPMHFSSTTLKQAVIRSRDLFASELSVWRASEKSGLDDARVVAMLQATPPAKNTLGAVLAPTAKQIRGLRSPLVEGRLFCVVDETDTDHQGGSDPAHAHIKICKRLHGQLEDTSSKLFLTLKEALFHLMRQHVVWGSLPQPPPKQPPKQKSGIRKRK
jgi:hypothetical protein